METVLYNLGQAVGAAIIHSLWQALLVYLVLRAMLAALPGISAGGKYNLSVAALMSISLWFLFTLVMQLYDQNWGNNDALQETYPLTLQAMSKSAVQVYQDYSLSLRPHLPYISLLYMCGLILQTTRLMWNRQQLNQLKQSFIQNDALSEQVSRLAKRLSLNKTVFIGLSKYVTVPCVAGYLKPILLLPASVYTCLSAAEIEAIIIHELAHVKRHDYLVNYMQQLLATVMFFNPFTHLINRIINTERENCCDDMVVSVTGQPLNYAYALLKLQETQTHQNTLALAATGKNYTLLNRIERIMKTQKPSGNIRHLVFSLALLAGSICSIAWLNPEFKDGKLVVRPVKAFNARQNVLTDTLPKHHKMPETLKVVKTSKPKLPKAAKPASTEDIGYAVSYSDDPKLDRLTREVDKQAAIIDKYYNSPKYLKLQQELEKVGEKLDMFQESPEIKGLQERFEKQSSSFDALNNDPQIEKINSQIDELSNNIDQYYNSTEYKKALDNYEKAEKELGNIANPNSNTYKARYKAFQKAADNFNKYQHSQYIKNQQDEIRILSGKMREFYNSAEYVKQRDAIKLMSDSIGKAFHNPKMKGYREQMNALQKQLQLLQSTPELKLAHLRLKQASQRVREYMNSAEFKKRNPTYMSNGYTHQLKKTKVEKLEIKEKPKEIIILEPTIN
ncbi:M56 family metallopeptidase [Mucilaginibacter terrae]|uniref:Bla regulator protein BlaR1 n=1 Tax=Mucilaginibacter terrae TaxID=1955052 RepID=A0ABU3GWU7_9SPHI|nr:M56 family metallopeptidase [Mucilaginibacter terrae]MDT3403145.1 bla regulator protein BlaR1 [Mucilaginibacter terrae]